MRLLEASLAQRLKRLMLLRLVMVTTLLLIAVAVEASSEQVLPFNPLYALIIATYVLTVLHAVALRLIPAPVALAFAQVVGDLLVITGLVYASGTTRTGFLLLYPVSVLSGAVLLYRRGALVLSGVATLFYAAVLWAVRAGVVPPQGLSDVPFIDVKPLLYSIFVTGVACMTVAMLGSWLSEGLRSAGERLEVAAGQVADLQELNQVILRSIQSGLLTADAEGHVVHLNEFGAGVLGRRASTVVGRSLHEVFGSRLLDAPALRARAADRDLARMDVAYAHPERGGLELGISVSALATGERGRGGYLLVFQDLTRIKQLEQDVRTKEKLAAVGEMAAQLAHEIRNPLGSISGSAQVLIADGAMSGEQGRLLEIITRESRRLSDTLNQFLFAARPAARQLDPVDLGPVVAEAVTLLRNGPEVKASHRIDFESDAGPHLCLADPDRILQVFWNLARNGLEAMPDGGLLQVRLSRSGESLLLTVRDQGHGMSRDEQRRIFEPFRSSRALGTGLGLAIVYQIVREHRGDIAVRSGPEVGTSFEVRLPLVSVAS
jgi:two-component system sensor histidine kinase PilS (NtrC family)